MVLKVFKVFLDGIEKVRETKLWESFLSYGEEKAVDSVLKNMNNIWNIKGIETKLENNLNSLIIKASDVEEHIKNAELSGKKKSKRVVEEWLSQVKAIDTEWGTHTEPEGIMTILMDGGKAAQLNEQVEKLLEQSPSFGDLLLDVCGSGRVTLLTTKMVGKAYQKNLEKIWEVLETGEVSRIAIYGMGGAGKTTLAMQIHSRLVKQPTRGVFWVTVSRGINIRSLQDKIASSLGLPNLLDGVDEFIIRANKLRDVLSKMNNSVLILDDVWEDINLLELGCIVSKECFKQIIITTRSANVCAGMDCEARIEVQELDKDEAWELFCETLGKVTKLSSEAENIAKRMAEICCRLPLAIVTVAGSMKGETTEEKWRDSLVRLEECVVGDDDNDKVFKVLKYSFDRLRMHGVRWSNKFNLSQLCFLYCSLYPEDDKIIIEELVGKLISDGLVEKRKSRRQEVDSVHVIVEYLVKVCLLESCVDSCNRKCVKMHDLVRAMALKIGGRKYMVRAGDKSMNEIPKDQEWTKQLEKVSLMRNNIMEVGEGTSPNCPKLSTLLLHDNINLKFIPDQFFRRMMVLRTLDLSNTGISKLSKSISKLKFLEALRLYECYKLKHVPSLGKLKLLKELNLTLTGIEGVPEGVRELINLKFLSLVGTRLKVLPRGLLLKLVGLQILRLPVHVQVSKREFQNLKQLEQFSGRVENVSDLNRFIRNRVHDRTIYVVQVGSIGENRYTYIDGDENVVVLGCNIKDEEAVLGEDIKRLFLGRCEGLSNCLLDDLQRWNNPTSLRTLDIESSGGIECLLRSDQQQLSSGFSTLERITLADLKDFKGLVERGEETGGASVAPPLVFSSLKWLTIENCNKMRRLGLSLSELPNLGFLYISECSEIEEIFKDESGRKIEEIGGAPPPQQPLLFSSLTILKCSKVRKLGISVLEVPNLEYLQIAECSEIEEIFEDDQGISSGVAPLPKLKKLRLMGLSSLKSMCKAQIISNSIEIISIIKCPELMKKMPLHLDHPPPPSLSCIHVFEEWWESLEWDNPNLPNLLLPFLRLI